MLMTLTADRYWSVEIVFSTNAIGYRAATVKEPTAASNREPSLFKFRIGPQPSAPDSRIPESDSPLEALSPAREELVGAA